MVSFGSLKKLMIEKLVLPEPLLHAPWSWGMQFPMLERCSARMISRFILSTTIVMAALACSCRCSQDGETAGGEEGRAGDERVTVTNTGEKLVHREGTTEPSPPPRLPGEKRRPTGEASHPEPTSPDPVGGNFTLEQAAEGLEGSGALKAVISADLGRIECALYSNKAPRTVANFIGLARGKRPWWDPFSGEWVNRPYYNGLAFNEVIPSSHIRGGSLSRSGPGGPGFTIDDEISEELTHDRAGVLSMASDGPNTNGAEFIILDGPAPHLNGRNTIFGQCEPTDPVFRIARVPQGSDHRPLTDVIIRSVVIERGD